MLKDLIDMYVHYFAQNLTEHGAKELRQAFENIVVETIKEINTPLK